MVHAQNLEPEVEQEPETAEKESFRKTVTITLKDLRKGKLRIVDGTTGDESTAKNLHEDSRLCEGHQGPCPLVTCRHNIFLDVKGSGGLQMNFPYQTVEDLAPDQDTCVLAIARKTRKGLTLEEVGELLNVTRERIRQIEVKAIKKLMKSSGLDLRHLLKLIGE